MSKAREVCENGKDVLEIRLFEDGAVRIMWKDTGCQINLTSDEFDSLYAAFTEMCEEEF